MASASVTGIIRSAFHAAVAAKQRQADQYARSYREQHTAAKDKPAGR